MTPKNYHKSFLFNVKSVTVNKKILIVLLILALSTRLVFLDARPMDHDESVHAYLSFKLLKFQQYRYDPAFHGPFLYFASAGLFSLLGITDFVARLTPVIFSIIGIICSLFFIRWLGNGAYVFTFLMLFSPSALYYSRYMRNDIILVGSFLIILYCYFRYRETENELLAYLAAVFIGVMLTAKENGYIYLLTLVSFAFLLGVYEKRFDYIIKTLTPTVKKIRVILIFAIIFGAIFVSLYSSGFSDQDGLERATVGAFSHWFTMHAEKDHYKPIYYYTSLLLKYEFLPLGLALAGVPYFTKRVKKGNASTIELFAAYWMVTSLIAYHILAHKVPWLLVHLITPLAFFGSIYSGPVFSWENRAYRLAFVIIASVTLVMACYVTYVDYNNADEDLIYIQIQPSAIELSNIIIEKINSGEKIAIYEPNNDYWPLPWYLRDQSISYYTKWTPGFKYIVTSEREWPTAESNGYTFIDRYEIRPNYYMVISERE